MTKKQAASKKQDVVIQEAVKFRPLHNLEPWSCNHKNGYTIIEAYVMGKGDWETVAEVKGTAHIDHEATATYIARVVNNYERQRQIIADLISALELCLKCDGLTWEAETEAEGTIRKAKEI